MRDPSQSRDQMLAKLGDRTHMSCPACGVAVAPGYPLCPKCQKPMPRPRRKKGLTLDPGAVAGGTAVPALGDSPAIRWALWGLAAALLIGLAFFVTRGDDAADVPARMSEPPPPAPVPPASNPSGAPPPSGEDVVPRRRQAALDELGATLRTQRLWAQVKLDPNDPTYGIIESAYCDDPLLVATVDGAVPQLVTAGVTGIACYTLHNALIFSRELP
jgi:hypothetical protein